MSQGARRNWRRLAVLAAAEQDPKKLHALIDALSEALTGRKKPRGLNTVALTKRILFIDDEPGIRITLPPILEQRGFEVLIAPRWPRRCN